MLSNGVRHVCNFLKFSGYYQGQEVYWCTLVTEENPFQALPGPFALLLCTPKQPGFTLVSSPEQFPNILDHLDTGTDGYVKDCDAQVLQYIVPLFRAAFPLQTHSREKTTGLVFSNTSNLRQGLDKTVMHDNLAKLYDLYIDLVRLCNFHEDLFLAQCDAYEQVKNGCEFVRGPISEMQQGGNIPFMNYEQASNWLEMASWEADSEYYDSLDGEVLQKRIDFVRDLNEVAQNLMDVSKALLQNDVTCERLYNNYFKRFAAFELVFNDEAAFIEN